MKLPCKTANHVLTRAIRAGGKLGIGGGYESLHRGTAERAIEHRIN